MTTRYSNTQDRLRIAGTLPCGRPVVLWITQRLWLRLLPRLLQWLKMQCDAQAPRAVSWRLSQAPVLYCDAIQSFAQHAAVQQLTAQSPVETPADTPAHLVEVVAIRQLVMRVHVVFKDAQQVTQAALVLDGQQLRQWLSIVCRQWQGAQWPMQVWPDWLHTPLAAQGQALPTRVH